MSCHKRTIISESESVVLAKMAIEGIARKVYRSFNIKELLQAYVMWKKSKIKTILFV